jgi:hypothetical protein
VTFDSTRSSNEGKSTADRLLYDHTGVSTTAARRPVGDAAVALPALIVAAIIPFAVVLPSLAALGLVAVTLAAISLLAPRHRYVRWPQNLLTLPRRHRAAQ